MTKMMEMITMRTEKTTQRKGENTTLEALHHITRSHAVIPWCYIDLGLLYSLSIDLSNDFF
jgi:hypothetical protein